jgi:hypothetical protein
MFFSQAFDDGGHVVAQNQFGCGDSKLGRLTSAHPRGDCFGMVEERAGEILEFFAVGCEAKRLPVEQLRAEVLFQKQNLAAYGGLLDAVGDVPHGAADAAMLRDVIEQFEMMEIHRAG